MKHFACILLLVTTLPACTIINPLQGKMPLSLPVLKKEVIAIPRYRLMPPNVVMRLAWHPTRPEFAVVDDRLHVLIFDAKSKRLIHQLPITFTQASSEPIVTYSPDGRYLAAGREMVNIFAADTGERIRFIRGPYQGEQSNNILSMVFSPDSQSLTIAYAHHWFEKEKVAKDVLATYDVTTGLQRWAAIAPDYRSRSHYSTNLVYSPNGKTIFVGRGSLLPYPEQVRTGEPFSYYTFIDYFDSRTGHLIQSITPVHAMFSKALAISPDGRYLVSGTNTGANKSRKRPHTDQWDYIDNQDPVKLWDVKTHKLVRQYPINHSVKALAISPDGRYLAVHHNLKVALFDFNSGRLLQTVELPGRRGFSLSLQLGFSPDSKILAIPLDSQVHLLTLK